MLEFLAPISILIPRGTFLSLRVQRNHEGLVTDWVSRVNSWHCPLCILSYLWAGYKQLPDLSLASPALPSWREGVLAAQTTDPPGFHPGPPCSRLSIDSHCSQNLYAMLLFLLRQTNGTCCPFSVPLIDMFCQYLCMIQDAGLRKDSSHPLSCVMLLGHVHPPSFSTPLPSSHPANFFSSVSLLLHLGLLARLIHGTNCPPQL